MALDPRFVVTSDLESYFVDKDSGEPLAAGVVTFYRQNNPSVKKPVYQISSPGPGLYTYTALPNPCILSSVGTFQDAIGNNIVPYYFPWTGDPTDSTNVIDLYYITVYSSGGILQFTRIGWPNFSDEGSGSSLNTKNYIPNGQFLAHNDIVSATEPPVTVVQYGSGTVDSQAIAQGGWNFVHTTGGSSVFDNSFTTAPVLGGFGLRDFPRYAFNFKCTTFNASDTVRDLSIQWPNVYTFSADGTSPGTQDYTFFFHHRSNDGNSYTFNVFLIYNFGTGGSPSSPIETQIGTFISGATFSPANIVINGFPANAGTVGTNNDDYVAIAIRGPAQTWNAQFTDFALVFGSQTLAVFPVQTNAEQLDEGVAGWMPTPDPDGGDLYLPLVLTPTGMTFDRTEIGRIYNTPYKTAQNGELACDGSSYISSAFSAIGIPYARLFNKLYDSTVRMPLFGTGTNFVSSYQSTGAINSFILANNVFGLQTVASNGATSPTFTYQTNILGGASIDFKAYSNGSAEVTAICQTIGAATGAANGGTSGMTVEQLQNTALTRSEFRLTALTAAALGNGAGTAKYFDFANTGIAYRMWFQTATETAPAVVGTLIKVNLNLGFSAVDCAIVIANAIAQQQAQTVTCVVPGSIPTGSYFDFYASGVHYYAWYTIDGVGTDPAVAGATGIKVALLSTDVAANVSQKTSIALNSYQFAVPNMRGVFVRGYDPVSAWDLNQTVDRFGFVGNSPAGDIGTYELFAVQSHIHTAASVDGAGVGIVASAAGPAGSTVSTNATGIFETRPVNFMLNYVIKY